MKIAEVIMIGTMKLQVEYLCGQPIIVGHHSEARHRRDIKRMDNNLRNAVREENKVDYYQSKIQSIENNNVISSDDPQAIQKLEKKLKILEENKIKIKNRKHEWYELPYVNAEIKRIKDRIKELKELDELDFQEIVFNGGKVIHNKEINRIQILFDSKPNEEIRNILKSKGFRWSRTEGAWQRLFNNNGIKASNNVVEQIENLQNKKKEGN